jgi:signal transduction histidine kinase
LSGCVIALCGLGCFLLLLISVPLSVTFVGPLAMGAALRGAGALAGVGRRVARVLLGRQIDPLSRREPVAVLRLFQGALGDPVDWRSLAYLAWKAPYSLVCGVLTVASFGYAFAFAAYPVRAVVTHVVGSTDGTPRGVYLAGVHFNTWPLVSVICLAGFVWLLVTPWLVHIIVILDVRMLSYLTGSSPTEQRVHDLEVSRARVVDDAAAMLRQIERNLHDGAQARMVAVAMALGQARKELTGRGARDEPGAEQSPEAVKVSRLLTSAHEDAKLAIAELRELASGIHPPILDSGLDAALTSLVTVTQIPVTLNVELTSRPAPAIEAIVYFCAAELLTNVAKHSRASHAEVAVRQVGDRLELRVSDDGIGNADARSGSGLRGLADRVSAVDGTLHVTSPAGGPTIVLAVLPFHT